MTLQYYSETTVIL